MSAIPIGEATETTESEWLAALSRLVFGNFDAQDDMADFAVENAAELAELDRKAREKAAQTTYITGENA